MITGAHSIIYSKNPEADRAFLRGVLSGRREGRGLSVASRAASADERAAVALLCRRAGDTATERRGYSVLSSFNAAEFMQ
ncbi:MAG: hypothetical protein DLM73_16795 [Chthoniobacterales bacterium]|nr:MAG: hypothetical protein DLM73_16795 [Chthoniobacterales bacterium]